MTEKQQFELWKQELEPAIQSKVDELHFHGYNRATADEVWECTLHQLRKEKEFMHMHAFVNKLLTLKPQTYMTWLTATSYRNPTDYFAEYEN